MPLKLNSSGGGSVTLDVPSTGANFSATVPANTGTLVTTGSTAVVTPAMLSQPLTLDTAKASTSGAFVDFTGIPSWARRITVIFNNVSTNGTSNLLIQIGSGSFTTTGYNSTASSASLATASTIGLLVTFQITAATGQSGLATLVNVSSNTWIFSSVTTFSNATSGNHAAGFSPNLSGALDRIRITTVNGTDLFDAGSINILYEG